jgi:hypothetical protein
LETESLEVLAQVRAKLGEPASPSPAPKGHWESTDLQVDELWESEEESESEDPSSALGLEHEPEEEAEAKAVARSPKSRKSRSSGQKE